MIMMKRKKKTTRSMRGVGECCCSKKKISAPQPKGITCNEVSELVSVAENKSAVLLYSY